LGNSSACPKLKMSTSVVRAQDKHLLPLKGNSREQKMRTRKELQPIPLLVIVTVKVDCKRWCDVIFLSETIASLYQRQFKRYVAHVLTTFYGNFVTI